MVFYTSVVREPSRTNGCVAQCNEWFGEPYVRRNSMYYTPEVYGMLRRDAKGQN
jgi:hypothetical protein